MVICHSIHNMLLQLSCHVAGPCLLPGLRHKICMQGCLQDGQYPEMLLAHAITEHGRAQQAALARLGCKHHCSTPVPKQDACRCARAAPSSEACLMLTCAQLNHEHCLNGPGPKVLLSSTP